MLDHKLVWSYDSTIALIAAIESRYEDMHHPKKRQTIWTEISESLDAEGIHYEASKCKKKWENLLKTYKSTKDLQRKTGRSPTRFKFFDKLDELLGNNTPYPINFTSLLTEEEDVEVHNSKQESLNDPLRIENKRKHENTTESVNVKKRYYAAKEKALERKTLLYEKHLRNMEILNKKKLDLLTKKLELETRKVAALEALISKQK